MGASKVSVVVINVPLTRCHPGSPQEELVSEFFGPAPIELLFNDPRLEPFGKRRRRLARLTPCHIYLASPGLWESHAVARPSSPCYQPLVAIAS